MLEKLKHDDWVTIKDSDIIAIHWWKSSNQKTVIMEREKSSYVSARLGDEPNTLIDKWCEPSKASYCDRAWRQANPHIYRFNTFREMLNWLSKE